MPLSRTERARVIQAVQAYKRGRALRWKVQFYRRVSVVVDGTKIHVFAVGPGSGRAFAALYAEAEKIWLEEMKEKTNGNAGNRGDSKAAAAVSAV